MLKKKSLQEVTGVGEDVVKGEPLNTLGGSVNLCSHYRKQYGSSFKKFFKKSKNRTTYDSATPLLGIYLKKMKTLTQKDIFTPVFTEALFVIAKI